MIRSLRNITRIKYFLIVSFISIILGLIFILNWDKTSLHLAINTFHSNSLDVFFKYWTYVGDGLLTAIAVLVIGIATQSKYRWSTLFLGFTCLIIAGIFAQIIKQLVYPDAFRPLEFIGRDLLYLVPNVDVHSTNSFPSGHTTTAFAFFSFLAYYWSNRGALLQIVLACCAVLIGYSRMYLSQHFLEDVVMGACLGIISYLLAHLITGVIPFKKNLVRD